MSLGTPEIIIIFVLVLILFGPNRLPDLARTVGKGMRELRKASAEIQSHFNFDDDDAARNPSWREARREASQDARDLPPRDEPPIETNYEPYGALPRHSTTYENPAQDETSHDDLEPTTPPLDVSSPDASSHDVPARHETQSEPSDSHAEPPSSPAQSPRAEL